MTKKILALVMAAILAVTMLTFPAFAADSDVEKITIDKDNKRFSITWGSVEGASKYEVRISNGSQTTTKVVSASDKVQYEYVHSYGTYGGTYNVQVIATDEKGFIKKTISYAPVEIPIQAGSSTLNVVNAGGKTTATWGAQSGVSSYTVLISYKDGSTTKTLTVKDVSGTSYSFSDPSYDKLTAIKVIMGEKTEIASWTKGSNGGNNSGYGNVYAYRQSPNSPYVTIQWQGTGASFYTVVYSSYATGNQTTQPISGTSTTIYVPYGSNVTFTVYANGNSNPIGYAYLAAGATSSGGNNNPGYGSTVVAYRTGNGQVTVQWQGNGASTYTLIYSSSIFGTQSMVVNGTYATISFPDGYDCIFTVFAEGNTSVPIGYTKLAAGANSSNSGNNNSQGGITTQGQNCTVNVYGGQATVTWGATGSPSYNVMYYVDGQSYGGSTQIAYTNSATFPVVTGRNYTVIITSYNGQPVAYAQFSAKSGSSNNSGLSNITKTEVKNLKATPKSSYLTNISWDKKSGAAYYQIDFGPLDGSYESQVSYLTNVDIPYGSNTKYQVTVWAISSAGKASEVGHIYNVPGTDADKTPSAKDYVTNLKATSGNKKVTLSWTAANGASSYTIYYKRATSSKWIKAGSVKKNAVNLNGLTNDVTYNFKVVANGNDSGIATIAPSTTPRTVVAPDPDDGDDDVSLDDGLKLTGVSSNSKGSLTASWNAVSGATSYRVYVAEGASSTYKNKGTFTGTSATITGLTSGKTYKVRVVKIPVDGDLKSALQACPYLTVTVK